MEAKEFFDKARRICYEYDGEPCEECPLNDFCMECLFAFEPENIERLVEIVGNESDHNL